MVRCLQTIRVVEGEFFGFLIYQSGQITDVGLKKKNDKKTTGTTYVYATLVDGMLWR